MNRRSSTAGLLAATVLSLAATPAASAQAAPAPAGSAGDTPEDIVVLSPFVVSAAEDKGYRASSTLAGSRIRTDLKDVGSAISVVTEEFLRDTASKKVEDLLVYTTSSEVAGQGGSFLGQGDGAFIDSTSRYNSPNANTRIRGLAEADNTRDYFLSDIPWDSYVTGRIDIQRGPNAVLFGIGSPAGIINSTLDGAAFTNLNKVELQIGSSGSNRLSANFNRVLLPDELAVRVAGLRDRTEYKQRPAYKSDKRVFGAVRWDPKFLATDTAKTSVRANFEAGEVRSNQPRLTPPMDALTPWFETGAHRFNRRVFDQRIMSHQSSSNNWADPGEGVNFNGSPNWIWQMGSPANRVWDGVIMPFSPAGAAGTPYAAEMPSAWPNNAGAALDFRRVAGIITYDKMMGNYGAPYSGIYKARSLTDSTIFDFYNNLIEGENKKEWNDFTAFNFAISQTLLNDRVGFEFAYDQERAEWGRTNLLSDDGGIITVDTVAVLGDGSANPNVGRAMIIGGGGASGGYDTERERRAWRLTSFGKFDFKDVLGRESTAAKILGAHSFTAMVSSQESRREYRRWTSNFTDDNYSPASANAVGGAIRDVITYNYIDGRDLRTVSSPAGLELGRVTYPVLPKSSNLTLFSNTENRFITYPVGIVNADRDGPYMVAQKSRRVTDSLALVWQGYMLDDCLVPMVGYRRDSDFAYDAGAPQGTRGLVNVADPHWRVPDGSGDVSEVVGGRQYNRSYNTEAGQTMTYSLVAHTPKFINRNLPWGLKASVYYNKSANFQPDASRKDIVGNAVASPTGKTRDYGFTVSVADDRIVLKVNWFKTEMKNATLSEQNLANAYMIGAAEAWGQRAALATRDGTWNFAGQNFGTASSSVVTSLGGNGIVRWQPAGNGSVGAQNGALGSYSQAEIDAQYTIQQQAVTAWLAHPAPVNMQQAWYMTDYAVGGGSRSDANVAVTGDTVSKGVEYELTARPLPGLDISINASRTNAKRLNLAASYVDWVSQRWELYKGPAGEIRLWGPGNWAIPATSTGTVRSKFGMEFMPNYLTALALSGADVAELRPWRFNLVVNYAFQKGLKGFNIGAGYRWQGKQTIGYPVVNPDATGGGLSDPTGYYHQTNPDLSRSDEYVDIAHPFKGPAEDAIDLWIGYERKLTKRVQWRVQLNVRDALASRKLIPVTWNPDNTPGTYRIPEPMVWTLNNTFTF